MNSCCCDGEETECCHCEPERQQKTSLIRKIVGPYPDEVVMSALDNLLYWWGAKNIKHMMNTQALEPVADKFCPLPPSVSSACSLDFCSSDPSTCRSSSVSRSKGRAIDWRKASSRTSSPKPPCIKASSSRLSAAASCPRQRYPRVDFAHPAIDIKKRQHAGNCDIKERLEDACMRLKTYLSPKETQLCECNTQKWLWTRLVCTKNGCQVYEVYKDSNANCSPSKIGAQAPAIVFVVMRNGTIMPFESLKV